MEFEQCSNCLQQISRDNFLTHEAYCLRHMVLCPQCQDLVKKAELKEHQENNHAPQKCKYCAEETQDVPSHLKKCPERPVKCEICTVPFPWSKIEAHE